MALRHFITVAGAAAFSCAPMAPVAAQTQAGTYRDSTGQLQTASGTFCVPAKDGTGCPTSAAAGPQTSTNSQSVTPATDSDFAKGSKQDVALSAQQATTAAVNATTTAQNATTSAITALQNSASCGPVTKTLQSGTDFLDLPCGGAGSYNVVVSTTNFVGTLQFLDPIIGAGKRVMRGGVAGLDVSSLSYTGSAIPAPSGTTPGRSYNVTGGNTLRVAVSAYTSGSITVTIVGEQASTYPIINGEVQTSALVALLNGRSFTAGFPGGTLANVANGNYACLELANPTSSGIRAIFESRQFSTDVVTGQTPAKYYVINNATTGLPTTAATVNKRGAAGTSLLVATYQSLAALPTGGATGLGGYVPTGGQPYSPSLEKTLEPGENTTMCILGANPSGGVGATSSPSIILGWREQAVN